MPIHFGMPTLIECASLEQNLALCLVWQYQSAEFWKCQGSYEDKMYIWNPGELPQEISIDMLFEKHPSIARNPMIADTFFKTGMIESWGRGFERIKAACNKNKAILPKYTAHGKGIMVLCKESTKYKKLRKELLVRTIHGTVNSDENSSNDTVSVTNVTVNDENVTDDTVNDTVKSKKNFKNKMITSDDRLKKILKLIVENEQISLVEIAKELGVSRITIIRDIDKLKKQGLLQREGSDKKGRWIVKK